jgi:HAD superfamily hydrolase (TIGR01662 family)
MMKSNHKIKAIFFDLDGTLRHSVPEGGQVFDEYLLSLGHRLSEEDRLRAMRWEYLYWANSVDLRDDLLAHTADSENFWIEYSRRRLIALGFSPGSAREVAPQVSGHMGELYEPESIVPEDVRRLLPALKEAGYILAVISNREKPFHDVLASHHLSEYFHFALAAGEVDIYKPEPGVFKHALERGNVTAQETVYVGDNYFADVVGSRRAGLHPVLYDPVGVFPEADCLKIESFDELIPLVKGL